MLHGLLIDLSGTLHVGDHAIAGAIEAVERLRASGIPFRFCTNTTKESATSLVQRLQRLGFTVAPHEVFTSLNAAAALMRTQKLNPLTLLEEEAATSIPHDDRQPKDAVLVGLAPSQFHYNKLNKAFHLIQQGCPLFAIHKARYYATESNLALGPGPFVAALEYATNVKATVIGKPERTFFEMALHDMGLPSASTYPPVAIIGDDVEQDLGGGAIELQLRRYLVMTGKYQPGDENKTQVPLNGVFTSFPQVVDNLLTTILPKYNQ